MPLTAYAFTPDAHPPPAGEGRAALDRAAPAGERRIWELDPARLGLMVGALLGREEALGLLCAIGRSDLSGRDERLWTRLLRGCATRCALAEAVEASLDARTEEYARLVENRPMIVLADWWSRAHPDLSRAEVAGLLWRLSRDPRPHLEKLAACVAAELTARSLGAPEPRGSGRESSGAGRGTSAARARPYGSPGAPAPSPLR